MKDDERTRHRLAATVVRLIGLWILAGAAFKLLWGTPNDLPQVVRDVPLELGLTYRLAIGIELGVAFLAFLRPRWAWPLAACVLLVFDAVLLTQLGAENCGCFGSKISMPPWLMLAIDSTLLVALLATRPWSKLARGGPNVVMLAGACALGLVLPWVLDRQALPSSVESSDRSEREPRLGRPWVQLDVTAWVGKDVWDTPLARWIDVTSLPLSGLWVLYRNTCDHCAAHRSISPTRRRASASSPWSASRSRPTRGEPRGHADARGRLRAAREPAPHAGLRHHDARRAARGRRACRCRQRGCGPRGTASSPVPSPASGAFAVSPAHLGTSLPRRARRPVKVACARLGREVPTWTRYAESARTLVREPG